MTWFAIEDFEMDRDRDRDRSLLRSYDPTSLIELRFEWMSGGIDEMCGYVRQHPVYAGIIRWQVEWIMDNY